MMFAVKPVQGWMVEGIMDGKRPELSQDVSTTKFAKGLNPVVLGICVVLCVL
jgi:hypothetical protein